MADELKITWPPKPEVRSNLLANLQKEENRDRLSENGIFRHGYGLIPKFAMQDRELSITAKAIYAYLCSLCGGGETAFPSVKTIRDALGLGKEAYYTHRRVLEYTGYITVKQRRLCSNYSSNLYILNENPRRFHLENPEKWEDRLYPVVRFDGIRGAGYGILPRVVMTDPTLDAKAKALYAYLASLTGSGVSAFPSRDRLLRDLGISKTTYYKCITQLKESGYLLTKQRRAGCSFAVNDYYLLDNGKIPASWQESVQGTSPETRSVENVENVENSAEMEEITNGVENPIYNNNSIGYYGNPCPKNPDTGNQDTGCHNRCYGNSDQYYGNPCPKNPDTGEETITEENKCYGNPCPKNPDTGNQDTGCHNRCYGNPCPNFPDTRNPPTTNNKIYTSLLNPSIYLSKYTHINLLNCPDGWMDGEKREEMVENPVDSGRWETQHPPLSMTNSKAAEETETADKTRQTAYPGKTKNRSHGEKRKTRGKHKDRNREGEAPNIKAFSEQVVREELKESMDYDNILLMYPDTDMTLIDNLLNLMVTALCSGSGDTVRIGSRYYQREELKQRFLSLDIGHLRYVLECVQEREGEIRNLRAYYLAALLNAPDTINLYYARRVEQDKRNDWQTA